MEQAVVYIHINKCGGSSVKKALYGKPDRLHKTAYQMKEEMGAEFDKAFKLSVVRNPFSRLVSMYHYRKKTNQHKLKELGLSFRQWFNTAVVAQQKPFYNTPIMFAPCWAWIGEEMDKVIRLEDIASEWVEVMELTGCGPLDKINCTVHANPIQYYDDAMKRIVRRKFKKDFEVWYD